MGTTLTGTTPQDTYDSLIKVTDNGPLSGTAKYLSDGLGNDSILALSTARVGIGTSSPASYSKLQVKVGTDFNLAIGQDTGALGLGAYNDALSANADLNITGADIKFSSGGERMRITSAGNVGIGTSSPNALLEANKGITFTSGDTFGQFVIKTSADATGNLLNFGVDDSNSLAFLQAINRGVDVIPLSLQRYGGNVGIGTSSPSVKTEISGSASGDFAALALTNTNQAGTADAATLSFKLGRSVDSFLFTIPAIKFVKEQQWTSTGSTVDGALTFSTIENEATSEVARFTSNKYLRLASGTGGIQFNGDTAAANALDDYEEGTWTMGVSFGDASVGVTYAYNTGTYTKIGRQVTVNGILILTDKGTSTGAAKVTGLPYTIGSTIPFYVSATLRFTNVTFANQFQGFGSTGTTTVELNEITEAGAVSNLTNADFSNNSDVMVSFTYFV